MTITARIIADSISNQDIRMTTLLLRYPRFIHAELLTHKDLSRSSSSSRAIPTAKLIEDMRRDPAMPSYWGSNKAGMQAGAELDPDLIAYSKETWIEGMEKAISIAVALQAVGLHKQIANRVLEPFSHINVLVTATRWNNTFSLRRHEAAQPEIHELFDRIYEAMEGSVPRFLCPGEWHMPFADDQQSWEDARAFLKEGRIIRSEPTIEEIRGVLLKVSTARCARTSYMTFEGKRSTVADDVALYRKLIESKPVHASPSEHQGTPDTQYETDAFPGALEWENPERHGNLHGWIQHRKLIHGEYVRS